jgi:hypothetical protein
MITNTGKGILAKYLIGQAPSYASYIAVGCGPQALTSGTAFTTLQKEEYSAKNSLDFEMFRVPVISRGYVNEDDNVKLVLTAELPTEERYEITEVGVFSAGSNPSAGAFDSKNVYSFTETEGWEYHTKTGVKAIPTIYSPLDDRVVKIIGATASGVNITYTTDATHGLTVGTVISVSGISPSAFNLSGKTIAAVPTSTTFTLIADSEVTGTFASSGYLINDVDTNIINQIYPVFHTNADNKTFTNTTRLARNERCRFLNNIVMIAGNDSVLSKNPDGSLNVDSGNHIHITNASFNFNKNAPTDELRLAFSVVNKDSAYNINPDNVKILVEFSSSDTSSSGESAKFSVNLDNQGFSGDGDKAVNFATNRYFVVSKQLQELSYTSGFNWGVVTTVRVYVSVKSNGEVSDKYYVALDALRLENTSTSNPLYGLTGYSVMKTDGALPIIKLANTSNFIEFRIAVGVE